jgi:hypothetical protein
MQTVTRMCVLAGVVTASVVIFAGCATGPRYEYAERQDSASLEGPVGPNQGWENGRCQIVIYKLDGLNVNFMASRPGLNWPFVDTKKQLYLAPGAHKIALDISEIEGQYGNTGQGATGLTGTVASGSNPTITAVFATRHVYRFAAYLNGGSIGLILWDETGGPTTRSRVANWSFDGISNYSESPAPSGGHR